MLLGSSGFAEVKIHFKAPDYYVVSFLQETRFYLPTEPFLTLKQRPNIKVEIGKEIRTRKSQISFFEVTDSCFLAIAFIEKRIQFNELIKNLSGQHRSTHGGTKPLFVSVFLELF